MPSLETTADQNYQLSLPTVSFRIVANDKALTEPAGVHSVSLSSPQANEADINIESGTAKTLWLYVTIADRQSGLTHPVHQTMTSRTGRGASSITAI